MDTAANPSGPRFESNKGYIIFFVFLICYKSIRFHLKIIFHLHFETFLELSVRCPYVKINAYMKGKKSEKRFLHLVKCRIHSSCTSWFAFKHYMHFCQEQGHGLLICI